MYTNTHHSTKIYKNISVITNCVKNQQKICGLFLFQVIQRYRSDCEQMDEIALSREISAF